LGEKVLEDARKLKLVRNHIVDWVLLESVTTSGDEFSESLISFLERVRELKSRPPDLNTWSDAWFEAHSLFAYETFLYIVAALIQNQSFKSLHEIFTTHYLIPPSERYSGKTFDSFQAFYAESSTLQTVLAPEGQRLRSPAAELIKQNADRKDLPFKAILEADLLILMMAYLNSDSLWFPQTSYYVSYGGGDFPLFLRATQHRGFLKLAAITGIEDADKLRDAVKAGIERHRQWFNFNFLNFWTMMNMDKLDTLK
jgi:hypothetical protein